MNTSGDASVSLSDDYYRDVFEHAPDGMHSINSEGVIIACNQTWASMLGYEKAEIIGRRSVDLLTPASKAKAEDLLPVFYRDGEMHGVDFHFVRYDGSVLGVKLSATLHDNPGTGERFSRAILRAMPESEGRDPAPLPAEPRRVREAANGDADGKRSTVILAIEAPALREVCRQRLRTDGHAVIAIDRPLALLTRPRTLNYDLVCVDGSTFGADVLDVLDESRQGRVPALGIGVEREGLAASLPLPLDPERFLRSVDSIVRRRPETPLGSERLEIDAARRVARAHGREVELTPTQCRLPELLYERQPDEVPPAEILETVWGFKDDRGDGDLIRSHVRNLREKLAQIGLRDAVVARRGRGYALVG